MKLVVAVVRPEKLSGVLESLFRAKVRLGAGCLSLRSRHVRQTPNRASPVDWSSG